ncbi:MAG: DUF493 domain-containing protein [Myxococcales bacterium]|nr:DUF493 domain-containing protein [Myxococcales bacterium]MCB9668557.1 DUF493 domain-containing protein [Alphaproteobacteria bacterium]MCB9690798.1 DUF493 domain-containing protein [Alphaproteobacteria bacterium]
MSAQRTADREAALELLRSQHEFPGLYIFRVVVLPVASAGVVSGVSAALGPDGHVRRVEEHPSRSGKYVSLRLHSHLPSPEVVLDVYEVIASLDGVVMTI